MKFEYQLPPVVQISAQQNSSHATDVTYVAEISANSTDATTVLVYEIKTTLGTVSVNEAPTNSVTINLFAIEDPA